LLIPITCSCGKTFRVNEERLGQTGRCPSCGSLAVIVTSKDEDKLIIKVPFELQDRPAPTIHPKVAGKTPLWKDPVFLWGSIVPVVVLGWFGHHLWRPYSTGELRRPIASIQAKTNGDPPYPGYRPSPTAKPVVVAVTSPVTIAVAPFGDCSTVGGRAFGSGTRTRREAHVAFGRKQASCCTTWHREGPREVWPDRGVSTRIQRDRQWLSWHLRGGRGDIANQSSRQEHYR
jgi:hypothetical protein